MHIAVFEKCMKPFSIRVHSFKKVTADKKNLQIHYKVPFHPEIISLIIPYTFLYLI